MKEKEIELAGETIKGSRNEILPYLLSSFLLLTHFFFGGGGRGEVHVLSCFIPEV